MAKVTAITTLPGHGYPATRGAEREATPVGSWSQPRGVGARRGDRAELPVADRDREAEPDGDPASGPRDGAANAYCGVLRQFQTGPLEGITAWTADPVESSDPTRSRLSFEHILSLRDGITSTVSTSSSRDMSTKSGKPIGKKKHTRYRIHCASFLADMSGWE